MNRKMLHHLGRDLLAIGVMALIGLGTGLALNAAREKPLPLRYLPRDERIGKAVEPFLPKTGESPMPSAGWVRIDLAAFRRMAENKEALILDARPEVFHQLGHVPGAISLPREDFEARYGALRGDLERDKTRPIAVYCSDADCEDSQLVAEALVKLSYSTVFVFKGGWSEWTEAHLPEEKTEP